MKINKWLGPGIPILLGAMLISVAAAKDYNWDFRSPEDPAGWKLDGLANKEVVNGALGATATRGNPYFFTPKLEIDAGNQRVVKFRMRLGKDLQAKGCLLFVTEEHPQWEDRALTLFDCQSDGAFHDYEVDMSKNALWKGKVTQLRFQPFVVQWPLPEPQRKVEIASFRVINMAAATGAYGYQAGSSSPPTIAVTYTNTMSAQYIRLENHGDVEFSELEAYDASRKNVALKKPVTVSTQVWGDGALGNDGVNSKDNHVMMRSPNGNWWEVDLGKEIPLTHVIIHERPAAYCEGYRPLDGATFSILDRKRNTVASCRMEAKVSEDMITIPMDKAYFHQRDLSTRFGIRPDSPGNILARADGTLRLVVPDPKELASGSLTLSDLEGRTLRTVPLSRGRGDYAIPLGQKGYYSVTATATYDSGLVITKDTSAAVIGEPIDNQTRLKSVFGIQGGGQAFFELGAAWSWTGVMTHHILKSGSGYEWAPNYAYRVKNGKFDLSPEVNNVVVLHYLPESMQSVPSSQRGNSPTSPPNNPEEFIRFIKWVTSFIPDFVKYLGPIGEPSWSFKGSPEELARYHEVIAKAVREVRPDIKVIGPMMSPGNSTSLESIKVLDKLGMFAYLDGVSINPYVVDWPTPFRSRMPEADFIEFIDAVLRYFASTGRPDYPVYVTEFGWYSPDHVDELTKARYSSRAAILVATRPVIRMMNFFSLGGGGGFSYLNSDGTPRPVYPAMAHTFRWLSNCSAGVSTMLTPTLHLAAFRKGGEGGIAIWDTKGDSVVNMPIQSIKRIQDMMGRKVVSTKGKIMTSPSPLFIGLSDGSLLSCLSSATPAPGIELTPGQSSDIGYFDDVIMPGVFLRRGRTITASASAESGEYRLLGKANGTWRMVTLTIKGKPE